MVYNTAAVERATAALQALTEAAAVAAAALAALRPPPFSAPPDGKCYSPPVHRQQRPVSCAITSAPIDRVDLP